MRAASDCLADRGKAVPHYEIGGFSVSFHGPLSEHDEGRAQAADASPKVPGATSKRGPPPTAPDFVTVVPNVSEIGSMLGSWGDAAPGPSSEAVREGFCRWREVLEAGTGVPFAVDEALGREQLDRSSVWGFLDWLHNQRDERLGAVVVVSHGDFMRGLFKEIQPFHGRIRNGQVFALSVSWPDDAAEDASRRLRVYVVRHCVSCSNVLSLRRGGSVRRRPTLCADLEHVYAAARAILRAEGRRAVRGRLKLCSSPLPRAMLTAAALSVGLRGERLDEEQLLGLVRAANADPELGPTCCTVGSDDGGLRLDGSPRELDSYIADKGLARLARHTFSPRRASSPLGATQRSKAR